MNEKPMGPTTNEHIADAKQMVRDAVGQDRSKGVKSSKGLVKIIEDAGHIPQK